MNKIKNILLKIIEREKYAIPMLIIFTIVLLAYWPGILVSDSMVQWNQAQTGNITNWHPAYNTIYIMMLTKIVNNPGFVLFIQSLIMSLCIGSFLYKLEKYYKVNKIYLFIASILLAIIPLNYNSAVVLLKDSLYSSFIVLLASLSFDIINDKNYFKNTKNCLKLALLFLVIMLFRHNGIITVFLYGVLLIILYKKEKGIYVLTIGSIVVYFLMTTVGFKILNISEGNYANKYGPISHIFARVLNEDKELLSKKDLKELAKYVDIKKLEDTYNPYNMDYSINCQNIKYIKKHSNSYIKLALKTFKKNPWIFIKHYLYLDSFLYSPIEFKDSGFVGMFTETDLWVYNEQYNYLNENSKFKKLLPILKKNSIDFQTGEKGKYTMRPPLYLYISLIITIVLGYCKKNKKIILISLISLFNIIGLAIAMPVAMTRYVYSTILIGYLTIIWFIYELYSKIIIKRRDSSNEENKSN